MSHFFYVASADKRGKFPLSLKAGTFKELTKISLGKTHTTFHTWERKMGRDDSIGDKGMIVTIPLGRNMQMHTSFSVREVVFAEGRL